VGVFGVLKLVGGLALFLFGMMFLSEALENFSGGKLKGIVEKLTSNRFKGLLVGAGVTAVIQSSSATTVMVVGFVNSGLMKLSQAIGIIMGANIGTTITAWLISLTSIDSGNIIINLLKPASFSPVLAAAGVIVLMSSKSDRKKDAARILIGFAVLMFGMETMSAAVEPLRDNQSFVNFFVMFRNPVFGILAGTLVTGIIQSSSASVGILQALSKTGVISMGSAIPIVMGQNIGTCVTSLLSSVGAKKNARRAALIHLYFNVIGTVVFSVLFYIIKAFAGFKFYDNAAKPETIALFHTLFNLFSTAVLFPFANLLEKLAQTTIKGEDISNEKELIEIDERFLSVPSFAIEQCRVLSIKMANIARDNLVASAELLFAYDRQRADKLLKDEETADYYEDKICSYLIQIASHNLTVKDSQTVTALLQCTRDFERISDHAVNILETAYEISKKELQFTPKMKTEFAIYINAVEEALEMTVSAFSEVDAVKAKLIEPLEDVIDNLRDELKKRHIKRIRKGKYDIEIGFILSGVLTDFERVSDHCSNIAAYLIQIGGSTQGAHEYINELRKKDDADFVRNYNIYDKKYSLK